MPLGPNINCNQHIVRWIFSWVEFYKKRASSQPKFQILGFHLTKRIQGLEARGTWPPSNFNAPWNSHSAPWRVNGAPWNVASSSLPQGCDYRCPRDRSCHPRTGLDGAPSDHVPALLDWKSWIRLCYLSCFIPNASDWMGCKILVQKYSWQWQNFAEFPYKIYS